MVRGALWVLAVFIIRDMGSKWSKETNSVSLLMVLGGASLLRLVRTYSGFVVGNVESGQQKYMNDLEQKSN